MKDLTFCLLARIDSPNRLDNLKALLAYYSRHVRASYLVLEADSVPRLSFLSSCPSVAYRFVKDDNPVFHRTKYTNQMLGMARTPYAAVWDVDIITPVSSLLTAYERLKKEDWVMVYPFDGICWTVNDYFSDLFRKSKNFSVLQAKEMARIPMYGYNCVGGAFLVDIARYKQCGGENEHFTSWGPEDVERNRRLEILGHKPLRIPGELFHLDHARGLNSYFVNEEEAYLAKKEFCKICAMEKEELKQYIGQWEWVETTDKDK